MMMQSWFPDAKLGIFIHYGIYAVEGIPESWSLFSGQVTPEVYWGQLSGFTASKYNPEQWADLFAKAGAKYAVLTTKHHDGVALWDTKQDGRSVVKDTPAGRDLITPYAEALRRHDLKVGFYFSHLDWAHPDYASVRQKGSHYSDFSNRFAFPEEGKEDPAKWERFLKFHRAQMDELCTEFGPVDLFWFDGDWERDPEQWDFAELRDRIHAKQPTAILNSRLLGLGDYATPEQGQPVTAPDGVWEFCMTVNDSWGYQKQDHNDKSVKRLVRIFAETIGLGGNLLLDVGPTEDGQITPVQTERLLGLGRWVHKHDEAIYGTVAGLPGGLFYGTSTLSKDGNTLYLMQFDVPREFVNVRGVASNVKSVSVVGTGQKLEFKKVKMADWMGVPSDLEFQIPDDFVPDEDCTVYKVELEEPIKLNLGKGRS
ncbi:MAG: alpha-L-fucosidase [Armatimonadetes bacterium]|nr:alpha-L-fucosidase [Armatimonadota bacterium]